EAAETGGRGGVGQLDLAGAVQGPGGGAAGAEHGEVLVVGQAVGDAGDGEGAGRSRGEAGGEGRDVVVLHLLLGGVGRGGDPATAGDGAGQHGPLGDGAHQLRAGDLDDGAHDQLGRVHEVGADVAERAGAHRAFVAPGHGDVRVGAVVAPVAG